MESRAGAASRLPTPTPPSSLRAEALLLRGHPSKQRACQPPPQLEAATHPHGHAGSHRHTFWSQPSSHVPLGGTWTRSLHTPNRAGQTTSREWGAAGGTSAQAGLPPAPGFTPKGEKPLCAASERRVCYERSASALTSALLCATEGNGRLAQALGAGLLLVNISA